jgi:hypothetical protein
MDNVQNCDSYINIVSPQTYRSCLRREFIFTHSNGQETRRQCGTQRSALCEAPAATFLQELRKPNINISEMTEACQVDVWTQDLHNKSERFLLNGVVQIRAWYNFHVATTVVKVL